MAKYIYILMLVLLAMTAIAEDKIVLKQVEIGQIVNPLYDNTNHRVAVLFPLFLLGVVIIMVLLDFLAVGVTVGSLLILIIGIVFKILPVTWSAVLTMIICGIMLIFKMAT